MTSLTQEAHSLLKKTDNVNMQARLSQYVSVVIQRSSGNTEEEERSNTVPRRVGPGIIYTDRQCRP